MVEWYQGLDGLMQMFWGCAIVSSVVFLLQVIMSFVGIDSDVDFDAGIDFDGDTLGAGGALNMFTLRGLVTLVMGFGWTGVCCRDVISNDKLLVAAAVLVGILFVIVCAWIMRSVLRLEHNGAIKPADVVGCTATVYLRIPEGARGKIQVSINGSVHEYEAVANQEIATGALVRVVEVVESSVFRVEPL